MSSELTLYSRLARCACTNLPTRDLLELEQKYDAKIRQTEFPFEQRALRISKCLISCIYYDFGLTISPEESCSSCKKCWRKNQADCIKGTSKVLSACSSFFLCLGTCGAHTYCCEYRGYIKARTQVTPTTPTNIPRQIPSGSSPRSLERTVIQRIPPAQDRFLREEQRGAVIDDQDRPPLRMFPVRQSMKFSAKTTPESELTPTVVDDQAKIAEPLK